MEPIVNSLKFEEQPKPQCHLNSPLKFEMSDPLVAAIDLEAEIRQAQAQLSQLKKQRELIDLQQKVAEETRDLELARTRLLATTSEANKENSLAILASTPSKNLEPKNKGSNEGPQKKKYPPQNEPNAISNLHPDRRVNEPKTSKPAQQKQPQPKGAPPKQPAPNKPPPKQLPPKGPKGSQPKQPPPKGPQPKPSPKGTKNNTSNLSLDELRALAAASRSPARAFKADKPDQTNKLDQTDKLNQPDQPDQTDQPNQNDQTDQTDKIDKTDTSQPPIRPFNPPTQPASQVSAPPVPNVAVYNGRAIGEFKNFTLGLERHFDRYPEWYKIENHKVTRALKHITLSLEDAWLRHIRNEPSDKNTYANLCTFLIHQINHGISPEAARARYNDSYQRPAQSVTDFSNWMQQWEPHFNHNHSERDRMRHLFEHLMNRVRNEADKTHLDFDNYADFIDYLQRVEDSIESRVTSLSRNWNRNDGPRKRPRLD